MPRRRRVALLIDTSTSWGVRLIKGINRFAQEESNWLVHVEPRGRYERFRLPQGWQGDGVIARVTSKPLAEEIIAAGLPAVSVSWFAFDGLQIARCTVNEEESGRMAADYFLGLGFREFAYCGPLRRPGYEDVFAAAYRSAIEAAGHACRVYPALNIEQRSVAWDAHLASLTKWLRQLPHPTGLLCWSAARGRQVTEACHYAGIRVPDEIAVLGGDFDELMSHISTPPLSTIDQPAEQIGYQAARLLERLMSGDPRPKDPLLFPPTQIIVRHSTDTLAIDDELVREALSLIRQRATEGIRVSDVVGQLAIARRALEQRFVRVVGRTPGSEIRRVRIEAAKRMLVETDRSMAEISRTAGFNQQDLFSRTFRRQVGLTPSQFRRQHQG